MSEIKKESVEALAHKYKGIVNRFVHSRFGTEPDIREYTSQIDKLDKENLDALIPIAKEECIDTNKTFVNRLYDSNKKWKIAAVAEIGLMIATTYLAEPQNVPYINLISGGIFTTAFALARSDLYAGIGSATKRSHAAIELAYERKEKLEENNIGKLK